MRCCADRRHVEADAEPVEAVDDADHERQLDLLLFVELGVHRSYTSSGAPLSANRVSASVQASAARSRALNSGVSRHASSRKIRSGVSPACGLPWNACGGTRRSH